VENAAGEETRRKEAAERAREEGEKRRHDDRAINNTREKGDRACNILLKC